ncbi:MAG: N-acetyltransferase [Peptococcaceae bacterium]|nr:N-acetyltransferase [Peptococcaceae bacterium]
MIEYRRARLSDTEDILRLINYYAEKGLMLPRTRSTIYEGIREFIVAEKDKQIVAVGSLHIIWEDLAEIRALAVDEKCQGRGIGRQLVYLLLQEAAELDCPEVFTLTYQVKFFQHLGFKLIDKEKMPHKVWKECINCVKFPNCDESALIIKLKEDRSRYGT